MTTLRDEILSKYSGKKTTTSVRTGASSSSLRDSIIEKYSDKKKEEEEKKIEVRTRIPATEIPPAEIGPSRKKGFIQRGFDKFSRGVEKVIGRPEESELGTDVTANTLKFLPSAFVENLPFGFGSAIKAIRDNPELAAEVAGDSLSDSLTNLGREVPGSTVDVAKEMLKAPIRGGANLMIVPVKFNIPGLGEISNAQYNTAYRINQGEDPVVVSLQEGSTAIFDTLFFAGIASKPFTPRPQKVAVVEAIPVTKGGAPQPKSFRFYKEPTKATMVPREFIQSMKDQGYTVSSKYNPNNPVVFRQSVLKSGVVRSEVIQIRPSHWNTIKAKFTATPRQTGIVVRPGKTPPSQVFIAMPKVPESAITVLHSKDVKISDIESGVSKPFVTMPDGGLVAPHVNKIISEPITDKTLETIKNFTPDESSAFGRKIISRINEEVGTKITEGDTPGETRGGITISELPSQDGRPAQFKNGKIEIFMPDIVRDLKTLADGGRILAHEEIPQYSKAYELKKGESMEELSVRYIKDVFVHELSHQKTMNIEDVTTGQRLQNAVNLAVASKDKASILKAENARDIHLRNMEEKALAYEQGNRAQLEKDLFGDRGPSTARQILEDQKIAGGPPEKVTISKKKLLKERIKAQAKGARAGKTAGKEEGKIETQKAQAAGRKRLKTTIKKRDVAKEEALSKKQEALKDVREKRDTATKELRVGYQEAIKLVRDKRESIHDKRKILTGFAKAFLPASVKGKFLDAIVNIKTDKDFAEVLNRMKEASDLSARKSLLSDIQSELKATKVKIKSGLPKSKFEQSAQQKLNRIRENIHGDYARAQEKMYQIILDHQTLNHDPKKVIPDALPQELLSEIQLLKMVGIKDMQAKELRSVLRDIQSIKETGRTLREIEQFNKASEVQRRNEKLIVDVSGGKKSPSDEFLVDVRDQNKTLVKTAKQGYSYLVYSWEDMMDIISFNDKTSLPFRSLASREGRKIKNAEAEKINNLEEKIEEVREGIKSAYELKTDNQLEEKTIELGRENTIGTFKNSEGQSKKLILTKEQAIKAHMLMKSSSNDASFETMLWTPEIKNAVTDSLSPQDLSLAEYLLEDFYLNYPERINEVYSKLTGTDLPFTEDGTYSPAFKEVETDVPASLLLAQQNMSYSTAKTGSLKTRVKSKAVLKIPGALAEAFSHIEKMEHYIAYEPVLTDLRSMFANKEVRKSIEDFYGRETNTFIDNALNDFARGGIDPTKQIAPVDYVRKGATVAMLGIFSSWKVPVKQTVSGLNFMMELSPVELTKGTADFWKHPVDNYKHLFDNSALLRQRYESGFHLAMKEALEKGYQEKLSRENKIFNRDNLFIGIKSADKITIMQGAHAAYIAELARAKKAGLSPEKAEIQAMEYAEDVVDRTQESAPLWTLSEFQRGGSLARTIAMFTSQQVKIQRVISNGFRNIKAGRGSKKRHFSNILMAWLIVPFIYNLVGNQLTKEEYRESKKQLFLRAWLGPLTYVPLFGKIAGPIIDKMMGESFGVGFGGVTPALSFADDLLKVVESLSKADTLKAATYLLDAFAKLKGWSIGLGTKKIRKELKEGGSESVEGATASF